MKFFTDTFFAQETRCYSREFVLEDKTDVTGLAIHCSWAWCKDHWCRSKQAGLSTCGCTGPEILA